MADHSSGEIPIWVDAIVRAWRTFYVSVGIDILASIGVGVITLMDGGDVMTLAFWTGVVGLVVRSILTGIATYWMRLKFPPKTS
jgi:uncharacterized membrane protein